MRVERIDELETLSEAQRVMLAEALQPDPEVRAPRFPEGAELVVYRLDDGGALVAPQNLAVRLGMDIVGVGVVSSMQRVTVSEGQVPEQVDLDLAEGVRPLHFPPRR